MKVRVVELEGGLDPDEYCNQRGADAYRAKLDQAGSYFYWLADRGRTKYDMRTGEGRVAAFQFLLPAIQRLSDKLERVAVANDVASYLGVEAGLILEHFRKAATERRDKTVPATIEPVRPIEKILLNLLLINAEARQRLIPEPASSPPSSSWGRRASFARCFRCTKAEPAASPNWTPAWTKMIVLYSPPRCLRMKQISRE